MIPSAIGMSSVSGVFVFAMPIRAGRGEQFVAVGTERDRDHLDAVGGTLAAEQDALPVLVEVADQEVDDVEVPCVRRQVHRLERPTALVVNDAERLDHLGELGQLGQRAGAAAALDVVDERRAPDRTEDRVVAADHEVALGVAGAQGELGGRAGDRVFHQIGVEQYDEAVDPAARIGVHLPRPVVEHAHTRLGQQPQRRLMDVLDVVVAQHPHRLVRVAHRRPRRRLDRPRHPPIPTPHPPRHAVNRNGMGQTQTVTCSRSLTARSLTPRCPSRSGSEPVP